jgi:hypothetical protein
MRLRSLVCTAIAAGFMLSAAAPAFADRDDHGRRDWHGDRGHPGWHGGPGYAAPPVVVAPPAYGYYAPPPVAYGPPGISIGINLP